MTTPAVNGREHAARSARYHINEALTLVGRLGDTRAQDALLRALRCVEGADVSRRHLDKSKLSSFEVLLKITCTTDEAFADADDLDKYRTDLLEQCRTRAPFNNPEGWQEFEHAVGIVEVEAMHYEDVEFDARTHEKWIQMMEAKAE